MAKPFANGDFDKNGEFGENVEYSESSSRLSLKSGNFGEYGENDEFDVARAPLIVVMCRSNRSFNMPRPPGYTPGI